MELLFPSKLHFLPSKTGKSVVSPLLSPKFQFRRRRGSTTSVSTRQIKLRSELNGKTNGALFGESDPRMIDRQKALEAAMNDINSSFGRGSVTRLGSAGGALVETFPSGCLTLDFALGGGLPKGRIVELNWRIEMHCYILVFGSLECYLGLTFKDSESYETLLNGIQLIKKG